MASDRTTRLFYRLALAAFVASAGYSAWLGGVMPRQMARESAFATPILAFELARTPRDLLDVFGAAGDPARPARIAAMFRGHELDAGFLLLYNGFLALALAALARERGGGAGYAALALPALAAACDAWENVVLVALLGALDDPGPLLPRLALATWSKWGAIALATGFAAVGLFGLKRRVFGAAACLPIASVLLAYLSPARFGEWMVPALGLAWLLLAVHAAQRAPAPRNGAPTK